MLENRYYDATLNIDGTADELASFAERYTDDYSDEALEKIISILRLENKPKKAQRISFELESRIETRTHKFDLGRIKLWALDGMYELVDSDHDNYHLDVCCDRGLVYIRVRAYEDDANAARSHCVPMSLTKFLELSADDFEKLINESLFYAQPES